MALEKYATEAPASVPQAGGIPSASSPTAADDAVQHAASSRAHEAPAARVFRREGEFWTVRFDGRTCHLRDSRGLQHLVELLRRPGQPVAALALTRAAEQGEPLATADEGLALLPRASENARVGVTRAIGAALRRIEEHHPSLGAHLRATVRTGQRCVYTPDPCVPVAWET